MLLSLIGRKEYQGSQSAVIYNTVVNSVNRLLAVFSVILVEKRGFAHSLIACVILKMSQTSIFLKTCSFLVSLPRTHAF